MQLLVPAMELMVSPVVVKIEFDNFMQIGKRGGQQKLTSAGGGIGGFTVHSKTVITWLKAAVQRDTVITCISCKEKSNFLAAAAWHSCNFSNTQKVH